MQIRVQIIRLSYFEFGIKSKHFVKYIHFPILSMSRGSLTETENIC